MKGFGSSGSLKDQELLAETARNFQASESRRLEAEAGWWLQSIFRAFLWALIVWALAFFTGAGRIHDTHHAQDGVLCPLRGWSIRLVTGGICDRATSACGRVQLRLNVHVIYERLEEVVGALCDLLHFRISPASPERA